ncbi:uncharacterized protein L3040_005086 [Drepanopeziza brunnea f. sp. 'multigermtubi']|uniref:Uncharacterized protein n=1 Tax=Marssonina brunnea f. sp. multigermtubi (strain MB_m1) TaxID=1072389 RepID=K1WK97_MARBU|nr:uncharacterized protein MBM_08384 [Drepanopeziza brunnea f. sp. 'multigermtubi' MB_m1]EKD13301.1 hypothetical protein MBM_08384 [Drepanopeziza brunnea f. sp. 'multigermtubi' MB_m1]KAJ5041501.1 hypothetical protein L3040_005086 [Drepanopeziza brunnea f. sp. 'multigermtubi']
MKAATLHLILCFAALSIAQDGVVAIDADLGLDISLVRFPKLSRQVMVQIMLTTSGTPRSPLFYPRH